MAAPNLGGTGSAEHNTALAFNGGVARRNSINQANGIHAMVPTGAAPTINRGQLEGLRAGGAVPSGALMGLIPPGSEQNWDPNRGGGRAQIRTGRNFQVPDSNGGQPFRIRVHTNDMTQPIGQNAGGGPVLRVEQGNQLMLSAPIAAHPDARQIGRNWVGSTTRDPGLINSAHVPLGLPAPVAPLAPLAPLAPVAPVAPAAVGGGFMPALGRAAQVAGNLAWHGSGASSIVGGTQQFYRNAQPGGTWGGMAMGAARAAAGAAWMGTLATTAPARAAASAAVAGVSAVGRMLWR